MQQHSIMNVSLLSGLNIKIEIEIEIEIEKILGSITHERNLAFTIPAGDLATTENFYVNVLGCKTGNR